MAKEVKPKIETFAQIRVFGIGGAGGAAVNRMIEAGVKDLDFVAINADAQALSTSKAPVKINIGRETTRGLGAGSDPAVGQKSAEESIEEIRGALDGTDMLFLALGAGGGTGSGAAHVVARLAKDMGILTVAFATRPFRFEGEKRERNAEFAISSLEEYVDTLVLIPNDKLLDAIDRKTPLSEAFKIADDVLRQGVQGISDLITVPGMINLDFADVKAIMEESGQALMGIGRASGDDRAEMAARQAIESPLLDVSIDGARGVLFNVIGGNDMTMHEINSAASVITEAADQNVNVIFGATINPELEGEIIITVVATGFSVDYNRGHRQVDASDSGRSQTRTTANRDATTDADEDSQATGSKSETRRGWFGHRGGQGDDDDEVDPNVNIEDIAKDIDMSLGQQSADGDQQPKVLDDYGVDEGSDSVWGDEEEEDLDRPTFIRKIRRRVSETKDKDGKKDAGKKSQD